MKRLRKPVCAGCPHELYYRGTIPQKQYGVMMHPGERFCTGGKKARRFKRKDPKIYVPNWCPRRKTPCEVRVYNLKNENEWLLHSVLSHNLGEAISPAGYRYALEYETHTNLTPQNFLKQYDSEPIDQFFMTTVQLYSVVEIDDGLKSAFFYKTEYEYVMLDFFNAEAARKNGKEERD